MYKTSSLAPELREGTGLRPPVSLSNVHSKGKKERKSSPETLKGNNPKRESYLFFQASVFSSLSLSSIFHLVRPKLPRHRMVAQHSRRIRNLSMPKLTVFGHFCKRNEYYLVKEPQNGEKEIKEIPGIEGRREAHHIFSWSPS